MTKVATDVTIPITTAPSNSKNAGTHRQAKIPTRNTGNNTYIYKAFIKSPSKNSKKFFIFSSSFILFYIYSIEICAKNIFKKVYIFLKNTFI